jgi:hypothetical protein
MLEITIIAVNGVLVLGTLSIVSVLGLHGGKCKPGDWGEVEVGWRIWSQIWSSCGDDQILKGFMGLGVCYLWRRHSVDCMVESMGGGPGFPTCDWRLDRDASPFRHWRPALSVAVGDGSAHPCFVPEINRR